MKAIPIRHLAENEIFAPNDPKNQATESICVKLCQKWVKGMREGMHTTMNSTGKVTPLMCADLAVSDSDNEMSERAFALFTHFKKVHGNMMTAWSKANRRKT